MSTITKPVAVLAQTEQSLCTAITTLADRVDQIGVTNTADALTRLAESIEAAKCRLSQTYAAVQRMTGDLCEDMTALADSLLDDLAQNDLPLPEFVPTVAVNGHAGNVRVEKPTVEPTPAPVVSPATVEGEESIHLTCPIPPLPCPHANTEYIDTDPETRNERRGCLTCGTVLDIPANLPPSGEAVAVAVNGAVEVPVPAKKKAATTRRKSGK